MTILLIYLYLACLIEPVEDKLIRAPMQNGPDGPFCALRRQRRTYSGWIVEACLPFGPCLTSKLTFWFSWSDLKPLDWISEKCANRSSPPSSGVMKPKPFASLNHLTVPVAIFDPNKCCVLHRDRNSSM